MKKLLVLLLVSLASLTGMAEYGGYHIRFTIKKKNGQSSEGYAYVAEAYLNMDSLKNTSYLQRALDQYFGDRSLDTFYFFKHRIEYKYRSLYDSSGNHSIYTLDHKIHLLCKDIQTITITQMIEQTYAIGISNNVRIADTSWMRKAPVMSKVTGGYLCSHQIFVHQNSKKISEVFRKLDLKLEEYTKREKKAIEAGEEFKEEDEIDNEIHKLLELLKGQKVVIVSECSC